MGVPLQHRGSMILKTALSRDLVPSGIDIGVSTATPKKLAKLIMTSTSSPV